MNLNEEYTDAFRFHPHWTDSVKVRSLIPAAVGMIFAAESLLHGRLDINRILIITILFIAALLQQLFSEIRRRKTSLEIRDCVLKFVSPDKEKTLVFQNTERVEIHEKKFIRILGGTTLRIYSGNSRGAWINVKVSNRDAENIALRIIPLGNETGRVIQARHSALIFAVTSQRITLLLTFSVFFTLFSGKSIPLNSVGFTLTATALADMTISYFRFRGLSLSRCRNGFLIRKEFFGIMRIFLPEEYVAGEVVQCSPLAELCGFGSLSLITSCGKVIRFACRVRREDLWNSATRVLESAGVFCTKLSDNDKIRKRYASALFPATILVILSAYFAYTAEEMLARFILCCSGSILTALSLRYLTGFLCSDRFGLNLSPSSFFAGGMKGLCAEFYILRRGSVAGFCVKSSLFQRMNGLSSAVPCISGGGPVIKCNCVSYGALNGLTARLSG